MLDLLVLPESRTATHSKIAHLIICFAVMCGRTTSIRLRTDYEMLEKYRPNISEMVAGFIRNIVVKAVRFMLCNKLCYPSYSVLQLTLVTLP